MSHETVLIRRATAADVAIVRDLTRRAYAKWVPVIGREPLPMTADYERALREHCVDLLLVGETLVGLVEMVPGPDHLLVENVAVEPAGQRHGYGRRLLAHADHVALCHDVTVVRLYTNALFAENIRFYRSIGFTIDREEAFRGGLVVHMSKRVNSVPPVA